MCRARLEPLTCRRCSRRWTELGGAEELSIFLSALIGTPWLLSAVTTDGPSGVPRRKALTYEPTLGSAPAAMVAASDSPAGSAGTWTATGPSTAATASSSATAPIPGGPSGCPTPPMPMPTPSSPALEPPGHGGPLPAACCSRGGAWPPARPPPSGCCSDAATRL